MNGVTVADVPSVEIFKTAQADLRGQISAAKGNRILASALVAAGQTLVTYKERELSQIETVSQMVWDLILSGEIVFPDGRTMQFDDVESWVLSVKWLFGHVDGPVPAPQTESGAAPIVKVVFVDDSDVR